MAATAELSSSSSSVDDPADSDFIGPPPPKAPNLKSDDITITLNVKRWIRTLNMHSRRDKQTNAAFFRFCAGTVQAGDGHLEKFNLSEELIRLIRIAQDKELARTIKDNFVWPDFLVAHYDGKIRESWGVKSDFLAVCVSGKGIEKEKVLGDVPLARGTGRLSASAVVKLLFSWGIEDRLLGLSFDNCSTNVAPWNGANVFIEGDLERQLLWLACLHHVLDLIIEASVVVKLGATSGPREKYFARFETYYNSLSPEEKTKIIADATKMLGLLSPEDDITREFLAATHSFFTGFMASGNGFQRGDYLELARLIMFFVGAEKELKMTEKVGAIHHARWMGAAIYILKMVICGEERVKMGQKQFKALVDLAYFIVYIFGRYWFAVPVAADAPFLTISLWNDLRKWASRDPALSAAALRVLERHTWYLSGRHVPFALFSHLVDDDTKGRIAGALLKPENAACKIPPGKPTLPSIEPDVGIEDFVTPESWLLFQSVQIEPTFLKLTPDKWAEDSTYVKLKGIVDALRVINDAGERAVKLGSDFTGIMTKSEEGRQNILQSVELARRAFPQATRKCFLAINAGNSVEELMELSNYDARQDK